MSEEESEGVDYVPGQKYEYGTLIRCDQTKPGWWDAFGDAGRCPEVLVWEKNGAVCCGCDEAFCEACCDKGGDFDEDGDFVCKWCKRARDDE